MGWENITVEGITTTNCNDNNFWTDYCPSNSTAVNNWRNWNTTYALSLNDSPKISYSELNTNHWIFGDASCGIECDYGNGYNGHLFFHYNNDIVLTINTEPERIQQNNYEYFVYFGINDATEEGSAFLIVRDPSDNTARQLNGQSFGGDWKHSLYLILKAAQPILAITSNGGGATHIAKVAGQLSSLSSNLSDILLVSGGGGGGLIVGETAYDGKDAGGISGSGDNSANQSTGYGFGQGESGSNVPGGGGGLYGGYKGVTG